METETLRPRQHAAHIMSIRTLSERRRYLAEEVPERYQALVREHVVSAHEINKRRG